jgi:hypothetical protein
MDIHSQKSTTSNYTCDTAKTIVAQYGLRAVSVCPRLFDIPMEVGDAFPQLPQGKYRLITKLADPVTRSTVWQSYFPDSKIASAGALSMLHAPSVSPTLLYGLQAVYHLSARLFSRPVCTTPQGSVRQALSFAPVILGAAAIASHVNDEGAAQRSLYDDIGTNQGRKLSAAFRTAHYDSRSAVSRRELRRFISDEYSPKENVEGRFAKPAKIPPSTPLFSEVSQERGARNWRVARHRQLIYVYETEYRGKEKVQIGTEEKPKHRWEDIYQLTHTYIFNDRAFSDFIDHVEALGNAASHLSAIGNDAAHGKTRLRETCAQVWEELISVVRSAGAKYEHRNYLGAWLEGIFWLVMGDAQGNFVRNAPQEARERWRSKIPATMPDWQPMLSLTRTHGVDFAIDIPGYHKMSCYPEVCFFTEVQMQKDLHLKYRPTPWEPGTRERETWDMFPAMYTYLHIESSRKKYGRPPGRVKQYVPPEDGDDPFADVPVAERTPEGWPLQTWQAKYHLHGVPFRHWRESLDIDLRGHLPIPEIEEDTLLSVKDTSAAPAFLTDYTSYANFRATPRRQRKKLDYAIKGQGEFDVHEMEADLKRFGDAIADDGLNPGIEKWDSRYACYISAGTRYERHKPHARFFYLENIPMSVVSQNVET